MSKVIRVQESTLADFAHKIVELAGEGYEISGTNEGYPQSFGFGVYTCQMVASEATSSKPSPKADKQEPVEAPQKPSEQRSEPTSTSGQETDENTAQSTTGTQKPTAPRRGRRKATPKK